MNHDDIREHFFSLDDRPPELAPNDIHCWVISLNTPANDETLDDEERDRASRFHFDRDRRRFIAGHVAIRRVLARYQYVQPHDLDFAIEEGGRPTLADARVNFNYSRSEEWGLLAISNAKILGADIEALRMSEDLADVARQHFSQAEQSALNDLSGAAWTEGFFNCWTRKEAIVKAMGVGLAASLDAFDVSVKSEARPEILRATDDSAPAREWALWSFKPIDGYQAAIATNLAAPNLHVLREKMQSGSRQ